MPVIETAAGKMFYAERDDPLSKNLPLILVHGAGSDHLTWPAELRRIAGRRVLTMDLPGHGRSALPGRQSAMAYAESVRQLMVALSIPRAIIVGHSMGGAVALTMGVSMPEIVGGLVLIATGARLAVNPQILNMVREDHEAVVDMIMKWAWSSGADEKARRLGRKQMLSISPEVTYGDYVACDSFGIEEQLGSISAPTLVIGSTMDKMTPLHLSETLKNDIPNATLMAVEGAGHMLPLEQPQRVADYVVRWLDNVP